MTELKTICEALKSYCEKKDDCKYCPFLHEDDVNCCFSDSKACSAPCNWDVKAEIVEIVTL